MCPPDSTYSLCYLVKRLQKKDFVTCTQSIDDKRIKIVSLTVAGKNICCNAEAHMTHVFDHMSEGLSENEKKILLTLLTRVQQNLISHQDSQMDPES